MLSKATKLLVRVIIGLVVVAFLLVLAQFVLIEAGREVVTLKVIDDSGEVFSRRLWIVDHDGSAWLHSADARWSGLFQADRLVELERDGVQQQYRALPVPGPHPEIDDALRVKYGLADRWVRFIAPDDESVLVVRLERTGDAVP